MTQSVVVEFCGEEHSPQLGDSFFIGRDADLTLDEDNIFLHRHFLCVENSGGIWWLINVGSQLSATVSDAEGLFQGWLAPGARIPLVFASTLVWFTAGRTTYELSILVSGADFGRNQVECLPDGQATIGPTTFSGEHKLLLAALCEDVLLRRKSGAGAIPQSAAVAARLGWTITKFNRKLDFICARLAEAGVRGLRGGVEGVASSRKASLVEYAMAARLVRIEDLDLLPPK